MGNMSTFVIALMLMMKMSFGFMAVEGSFDFLQLVQQYPPATCKNVHCTSVPPSHFTIHGLWPTNVTVPYMIVCPPVTPSTFNIADLVPIRAQLDTLWPDVISGADERFWESEWNKHGTCSNFNLKKYFQISLDIRTKPEYDLMSILNAAGLGPTPNKSQSKQDIANAIQHVTKKMPELRCRKKMNKNKVEHHLFEIVLCFKPDGTTLIDCPPNRISVCNSSNLMWY